MLIAAAHTPSELARMVDRRAEGLPLEQVLGWAEFCGLRIAVEPGVFVPRRRTEALVYEAAARARRGDRRAVVVDLCCGSGAVGAAVVATAGAPAELHAVDIDPVAVRCARRNVATYGGHAYEGDLYRPLPTGLSNRVDVLVANAPYVPTGEIALLPPEARVHEPQVALDGGADGLDVVRRVSVSARRWLAPDGHLLFETSERQLSHACDIVARSGLTPQVVRCAELDATVVIAR